MSAQQRSRLDGEIRVIIIPSGLRLLMSPALRDPTQGIGVAIVCLGLPAATGSSHRSLRPSSTSPASSQASNGSSAASPISSLPDAALRRLPRRCGHCWRRCKKLTHFTSVTAAASCGCSMSGRARRIKGSRAITARRRSRAMRDGNGISAAMFHDCSGTRSADLPGYAFANSQRAIAVAAMAPRSCAAMKASTPAGAMPA
jgi:hypothetical protein